MKIAVASGKGGTGKTTVAVSLALAADIPVRLLDCDVEEPNIHLFLETSLKDRRVISIPVPEIDAARCDGCGKCAQFCAFNALVCFGTIPVFAAEMCHGCGGCVRVCPQKAIREVEKRIGVVEISCCGQVTVVQGILDIGMALAPPLIRAVKEEATDGLVVMDAPPGTSCPVIATLRDVDFVVLVTEPTPFGLNDLGLAVDVVREMNLPFGVLINRATEEDAFVRPYCAAERIEVLAEIPNDRRIAEAYAQGVPLVRALPEYTGLFTRILGHACEAV